MRRTRRTLNGFTVVELLVVVAVIGIISASLIALSVRSYRDAQLRDGAVQLMTELPAGSGRRAAQQPVEHRHAHQHQFHRPERDLHGAGGRRGHRHHPLPPGECSGRAVQPASTSQYPNSAVYTSPYAEMGGAGAVTGVIWEVSSTQSSRRWYIKTVGVTGKVMLSAQAN